MPGSYLRRSWEISTVPDGEESGGAGKGNRNPAIHAAEKSDAPVVPKKPPNKGKPAEEVEERGAAKGNADESPASRTPSRENALTGLERVRETAKRERRLKFTALLHHITPSLLVESFYDLNKTATVGVDGVTWQDYENILYGRVHELHRQIHTGTYRAQASRRTYILKADGKQRPLGIAAVEDKIVQQAVVKVLSAIYEEDFLGFSYGFVRFAHPASRDQPSAVLRPSGWSARAWAARRARRGMDGDQHTACRLDSGRRHQRLL